MKTASNRQYFVMNVKKNKGEFENKRISEKC